MLTRGCPMSYRLSLDGLGEKLVRLPTSEPWAVRWFGAGGAACQPGGKHARVEAGRAGQVVAGQKQRGVGFARVSEPREQRHHHVVERVAVATAKVERRQPEVVAVAGVVKERGARDRRTA